MRTFILCILAGGLYTNLENAQTRMRICTSYVSRISGLKAEGCNIVGLAAIQAMLDYNVAANARSLRPCLQLLQGAANIVTCFATSSD